MAKRGGVRKGAGRPKKLEVKGRRLDFYLDETSDKAVVALSQFYSLSIPDSIRKLLASWYQSNRSAYIEE